MKIEQNESSLILSQTPIPDIFFTEYLSEANGDFVKVYLYLFFLSKYSKEIKINDLSKKLELSLTVIQEAIKYWEGKGLLIRKNQGFILANLQEIEINKVYSPKITMSSDHINEANKSKSRASAIETINNQCFQGVMSPAWYGDIDLWFKKYEFDEQVMIALFSYCFNKSSLHRNYIATVAESWSKNNVKSYSDLDLYFHKMEKLRIICNSIRKKLRWTRNLTVYEEAYVEKWNITYGYDMSIIEIALKQTLSKYNVNFEYLDKILSDWHERGFSSVEQINKYLADKKTKTLSKKDTKSSKTTSSNFTERKYEDLNDFYVNVKK